MTSSCAFSRVCVGGGGGNSLIMQPGVGIAPTTSLCGGGGGGQWPDTNDQTTSDITREITKVSRRQGGKLPLQVKSY